MKNLLLLLSVLCISLSVFAQQTIDGAIMHDGMEREYILYLPANYTGDTPMPLVLNYHGYTSNATQQMWYGDFRSIADTAGFIVVHPEGSLFNGATHWNVGGWTVGSTVDDVGFTSALIDTLAAGYNINLERVYATGMSNGGYMSFLLACQLSDKIAAIASVTGSMTPETYNDCNPQHPTPILQMHGTLDFVVPYDGETWTKSIDDVMDYWVGYNNCNPTASVTDVPDANPSDGSTVEHFVYHDGDNGITNEHFKVIGGAHTWPGTGFGGLGTNYDMDASLEIWHFFARYDINGPIPVATSTELLAEEVALSIYPNPTSSSIFVEYKTDAVFDYQVISSLGKVLSRGQLQGNSRPINLSHLPQGLYYLHIANDMYKVIKY